MKQIICKNCSVPDFKLRVLDLGKMISHQHRHLACTLLVVDLGSELLQCKFGQNAQSTKSAAEDQEYTATAKGAAGD